MPDASVSRVLRLHHSNSVCWTQLTWPLSNPTEVFAGYHHPTTSWTLSLSPYTLLQDRPSQDHLFNDLFIRLRAFLRNGHLLCTMRRLSLGWDTRSLAAICRHPHNQVAAAQLHCPPNYFTSLNLEFSNHYLYHSETKSAPRYMSYKYRTESAAPRWDLSKFCWWTYLAENTRRHSIPRVD